MRMIYKSYSVVEDSAVVHIVCDRRDARSSGILVHDERVRLLSHVNQLLSIFSSCTSKHSRPCFRNAIQLARNVWRGLDEL